MSFVEAAVAAAPAVAVAEIEAISAGGLWRLRGFGVLENGKKNCCG